jgi:hypothetical protein
MRPIRSAQPPTSGSTCVSSLKGRFVAKPDLRVRPVPEWDGCVVYDPDRRRLIELNLVAALVLELCEHSSYTELGSAFTQAIGSRLSADEINRLLMSAVMKLIGAGLIVRHFDGSEGECVHG